MSTHQVDKTGICQDFANFSCCWQLTKLCPFENGRGVFALSVQRGLIHLRCSSVASKRWKKEDMQNMQCHLQVAFGSRIFAWGIYRLGECDVPGWLVVIPVFYPEAGSRNRQRPGGHKSVHCRASGGGQYVAFSCSLIAIPCASFDSLWHPAKIVPGQAQSCKALNQNLKKNRLGNKDAQQTMSQNSGYEVSWWLAT